MYFFLNQATNPHFYCFCAAWKDLAVRSVHPRAARVFWYSTSTDFSKLRLSVSKIQELNWSCGLGIRIDRRGAAIKSCPPFSSTLQRLATIFSASNTTVAMSEIVRDLHVFILSLKFSHPFNNGPLISYTVRDISVTEIPEWISNRQGITKVFSFHLNALSKHRF